MIREYYRVAKPGIVYGNALSVIAGYLFGGITAFDLSAFLGVVVGACLVMAGGCVFNNIIDIPIDRMMKRTKQRALVTGVIPVSRAFIYGVLLSGAGLGLLWWQTNRLTVALGVLALLAYVALYGWAKRTTTASTLIGAISGGLPPVAGYTAATGRLDMAAVLLFLILAAWQMPHFYAVAIFRREEYLSARIPLLSVVKGNAAVRRQILVYIVVFAVAAASLAALSSAGLIYMAVMLLLSAEWLRRSLRPFTKKNQSAWARSVFGFSLIVLLVFSATVSVAPLLP